MHRRVLMLFLVVLLMISSASCNEEMRQASLKKFNGPYPAHILGIYHKGSNVTEPRPQKSSYLQTNLGGVVILENGVGFFLEVNVIRNPEKEMYIQIKFENPLDSSNPAVTDWVLKPGNTSISCSSPEVVKGIRNYKDYTVTIDIFADSAKTELRDRFVQKIRSYVDTTGEEVMIFKNIGL